MLIRPKVRMDSEGSGEYGAPRGKRKHKGIDFCVDKGVEVRSHIDGVVSKLGKPYYFANPNKKKRKKSHLLVEEDCSVALQLLSLQSARQNQPGKSHASLRFSSTTASLR